MSDRTNHNERPRERGSPRRYRRRESLKVNENEIKKRFFTTPVFYAFFRILDFFVDKDWANRSSGFAVCKPVANDFPSLSVFFPEE